MQYNEIKENLELLNSPIEKLDFVMELSDYLKVPKLNIDCYDISGCSSNVKLCIDGDEFYGKSDSKLIAGVLVILLSIVDKYRYNNKYKQILRSEFLSLNLEFGIGRVNGINSIINFLENL